MLDNILEQEVTVFCHYLIGRSPSPLVKELYFKAIKTSPEPATLKEKNILAFAIKNKWSLPLLDAGSAILKPESELRKRLYILFAILESMPDHSDLFLAKSRSPFYLITIFFVGIRASLRAILGTILYAIL